MRGAIAPQSWALCGWSERERTNSWKRMSASTAAIRSFALAASPIMISSRTASSTRSRARRARFGRGACGVVVMRGLLTIRRWLTIPRERPSVQLLRVTSVKTTAVRVPLVEPLKWSGGIRESASGLVVEVATDEGIVGVGEAPGPTLPAIQAVIDRELTQF